MWATEAIPFFVTALLVPGLVVFGRVLLNVTNPVNPAEEMQV